jgi:hypothetical protein
MGMKLLNNTLLTAVSLLMAAPAFAAPTDLSAEVQKVKSFIKNEMNRDNCGTHLSELKATIDHVTPRYFDIPKAKAEAKSIVKELFLTRIALADKLREMSKSKPVDDQCIKYVRESVRASRYIEEYLAKLAGFNADVDVLEGDEPYLLVNPKFGTPKDFKLQSGDIVISRGNAIVSAAIARIGDVDGHFSHAAMAYVDEDGKYGKPGTTYMIEAHLEIGTDVADIEQKYKHDGKVRAIVYRQKDPMLAKKAAQLAYDTAMVGVKANRRIPYDFNMEMDPTNTKKIFCSKVPLTFYYLASNGTFLLGDQYMTTFTMENRDFLTGIGVSATKTFSPSDVEYDGKLELVAEWRDLGATYMANRKDAVLYQLFDWMEKDGYTFNRSRVASKALLLYTARQIPVLGDILLGEQLSRDVKPLTLRTMFVMDFVGDKMLDDLIEEYNAFEKKEGFAPTFNQMKDLVTRVRDADLVREAAWLQWRSENPDFNSESEQQGDHFMPPPGNMPEKPHFIHYLKRPELVPVKK